MDEYEEDGYVNSQAPGDGTVLSAENLAETIKPNAVGDGRDFERWLFSDWLNKPSSSGEGGRRKEPALPVLREAKWNSGDNPVLVTAAM